MDILAIPTDLPVGIFLEFSGESYENFTALAQRLRAKYEYELCHTSNAKFLPVTGPVVRMFKPFGELFLYFQEFDVDSIEKHIEESSSATVSFHDHDSKNRPYMVKFFSSGDSKVANMDIIELFPLLLELLAEATTFSVDEGCSNGMEYGVDTFSGIYRDGSRTPMVVERWM